MKPIVFISLFSILIATSFACTAEEKVTDHNHSADHKINHTENDNHATHQDHDEGNGHTYTVGKPATAEVNGQSVTVEIFDSPTMRYEFSPPIEEIMSGSVIHFDILNKGAIAHEFSIGNPQDQIEHAEMMRKMPNMIHADPNTITLQPGETGQLHWKFSGDELVVFACNIPGHFEAGMFTNVPIVSVAGTSTSGNEHNTESGHAHE